MEGHRHNACCSFNILLTFDRNRNLFTQDLLQKRLHSWLQCRQLFLSSMDGNVQGKALLSVGVDAILSHHPQPLNKTKASAFIASRCVSYKLSDNPLVSSHYSSLCILHIYASLLIKFLKISIGSDYKDS